jgi:hypothetical protein
MRSYFDYAQSRCTQASFRLLAISTAVATMLAFFSNWLDLPHWVISNLLDGFLLGAISTTPRVVALRVVSTSCHKHGSRNDARVLS